MYMDEYAECYTQCFVISYSVCCYKESGFRNKNMWYDVDIT